MIVTIFRLNCTICTAPNMTGNEVEWLKDGVKINHTGRTLILNKASASNAGVYICSSKNEAKMSTVVQILRDHNEPIQQACLL